MHISVYHLILVNTHITLVDHCDQKVKKDNLNNQKVEEPCQPNQDDHESGVFGIYPGCDLGGVNVTDSVSEGLDDVNPYLWELLIILLMIVTFQNKLYCSKSEDPEEQKDDRKFDVADAV